MARDPGASRARTPLTIPERERGRAELVIFSDDWGRHPSSCQHLTTHLLPRYRVHWVNTIGTRRPSLSAYTLVRGAGKLREWLTRGAGSPREGVNDNPHVLDPLMWPSFASPAARRLNATLLIRALRAALPVHISRLAVTTLPVVADIVGRIPAQRWVYYCVDDLSAWPGLDRATLERMERELLERVDVVVAASSWLADRMKKLGRGAHVLTHGIDLERWVNRPGQELPGLEGLARPLVVFWGVIDRRLDVAWLKTLGERLRRGTILMVGPVNEPDRSLDAVPNLQRLGPLAHEKLPVLAQQASVLIMPYADLPVTRAMQPLKLKEYLASGKPVVVRDLPAVAEWRDACDVAEDAEQFVELVLARIDRTPPGPQLEARGRLARESWASKARAFEQILAHPVACR